MTSFTKFNDEFKPSSSSCTLPSNEVIASFQDRLPDEVLEFWEENGWCQYADGLFQFDNPSNYEDILDAWFGNEAESMIALGHTSFCDLFLWMNDKVHYFDALYGRIFPVTRHFSSYLNSSLTNVEYSESALRKELFLPISKRLGNLRIGECYAFIPAMPLGGSADANSAKIVKFKEHALFLAQITKGVKIIEFKDDSVKLDESMKALTEKIKARLLEQQNANK